MAIRSVITLTHGPESIQTIKDKILKQTTKVREELNALRGFFHAAAGGDRDIKAVVQIDSGNEVAASGTITFSSLVADDTATVALQVFTAKVTPSGANQFALGANDTAAAANLAAKINAHTSLSRVVSATSALGVVTVTCYTPGLIGNQIVIAISAHGSVSGSGKLASGANATTYSTLNTYHAGV